MDYTRKILVFFNTGIIINNLNCQSMTKTNITNKQKTASDETKNIKNKKEGILLGYDFNTLVSSIDDIQQHQQKDIDWIRRIVKKQLATDIDNSEKEAQPHLLGYVPADLRKTNPPPRSKQEIDNYLQSDLTYKEWLIMNAYEIHKNSIAAIKIAAQSKAEKLGYTLKELEKDLKWEKPPPKTKNEITNYINNLSYEDWLIQKYESIAKAYLLQDIAKMQKEAMATLNLFFYQPEEIVINIKAPKTSNELHNYNGTHSYKDVLIKAYNDALLKKLQVEIPEHTKIYYLDYFITDLLANSSEFHDFKAGKLNQNWCYERASKMLQQDIKKAKIQAINEANLLKYTVYELDLNNLPPQPNNKAEFINYQKSNISYKKKLMQFYELAAVTKHEHDISILKATLTPDEIEKLCGYNLSDLLPTKVEIMRYNAGIISKLDLFTIAKKKLSAAIAIFKTEAIQKENLLGYERHEIDYNAIAEPTSITAFDNYQIRLNKIYREVADKKLRQDFLNMYITLDKKVNFLNYNKEELNPSIIKIPKTKAELQELEKKLIQHFQKEVWHKRAQDIAALNLSKEEQAEKFFGYTIEEILVTQNDINEYKTRGRKNKLWLHEKAQTKLHADIKSIINLAKQQANLLAYQFSELVIPQLLEPKNKAELINYDQQGNSYQTVLIQEYETASQVKMDAEITCIHKNIEQKVNFLHYNKNIFNVDKFIKPSSKTELKNYELAIIKFLQQEIYFKRDQDIMALNLSTEEQSQKFLGYFLKELLITKTDIDRYQSASKTDKIWLYEKAQTKLACEIEKIKLNAQNKADLLQYQFSELVIPQLLEPKNKAELINYDQQGNSYQTVLIQEYEAAAKTKLKTDLKSIDFFLTKETESQFYGYTIIELLTSKTDIRDYKNFKDKNPRWLHEKAQNKLKQAIAAIIALAKSEANTIGYDINDLKIITTMPTNKNELKNYHNTSISYKNYLVKKIENIAKEQLENEIDTLKISIIENNPQLLDYSLKDLITDKLMLDNLKNFLELYENELIIKAKTLLNQDINQAEIAAAQNPEITLGFDISELELAAYQKPRNKNEIINYANSQSYLAILKQDYQKAAKKLLNKTLRHILFISFKSSNCLGYDSNIIKEDNPIIFMNAPKNKAEIYNFSKNMTYEEWLKSNLLNAAKIKLAADIKALLPFTESITQKLLGYELSDLLTNKTEIDIYKNHDQYNNNWLISQAKLKLAKAIAASILKGFKKAKNFGYDPEKDLRIEILDHKPTTKTKLENYDLNGTSFEDCVSKNIEQEAWLKLTTTVQKMILNAKARAKLLDYNFDDLEIIVNKIPTNKNELYNFMTKNMWYEDWLIKEYEKAAVKKLKKEALDEELKARNEAKLLDFSSYDLIKEIKEIPFSKKDFNNYKGSNKTYKACLINEFEIKAQNRLQNIIKLAQIQAKDQANLLDYDITELTIESLVAPRNYKEILNYHVFKKTYQKTLVTVYETAAKNKLYEDIEKLQIPEVSLQKLLDYPIKELLISKTDIDKYKILKTLPFKEQFLIAKAIYQLQQAINTSITNAKNAANALGYPIDALTITIINLDKQPKTKNAWANYNNSNQSYEKAIITEIETAAKKQLKTEIKLLQKRVAQEEYLFGYEAEEIEITEEPATKADFYNYKNNKSYHQWLSETYFEKVKAKLAQDIADLALDHTVTYLDYTIKELLVSKNDILDCKKNKKDIHILLNSKAAKKLALDIKKIETLFLFNPIFKKVVNLIVKPKTKNEITNYIPNMSYFEFIQKRIQEKIFSQNFSF